MQIGNYMKPRVYSVPDTATIREAAALAVAHHIGLLPVVNAEGKPIGVVRLADLLSLVMPDFFKLLPEFDYVHDFGAVEAARPTPAELDRPITTLVQPGIFVNESSGLVRSYAFMLKHNLHDLLIISESGALVGIASRVDLGTAILSTWKDVEASNR
jgi:CBS domain-containing protein